MPVTPPLPRGRRPLANRAGETGPACCRWASKGELLFLVEVSTEAEASNQAFPFGGNDRCLPGRTDGVTVGTSQRSPIKAVAKCARHCHLTVTPAPLPRAFVYHGSQRGLRREPGPGATVPGEPGRAEERAFRRRSPRLTSPPFYHSRTRFLNLIPNVPAPKFWTLEAKTVNATGIGRRRLF